MYSVIYIHRRNVLNKMACQDRVFLLVQQDRVLLLLTRVCCGHLIIQQSGLPGHRRCCLLLQSALNAPVHDEYQSGGRAHNLQLTINLDKRATNFKACTKNSFVVHIKDSIDCGDHLVHKSDFFFFFFLRMHLNKIHHIRGGGHLLASHRSLHICVLMYNQTLLHLFG